jgi:hypothetical protein
MLGFTGRYIINKHVLVYSICLRIYINVQNTFEICEMQISATIPKKNLLGCYLGDLTTGNIIMLFYCLETVDRALLQSLFVTALLIFFSESMNYYVFLIVEEENIISSVSVFSPYNIMKFVLGDM